MSSTAEAIQSIDGPCCHTARLAVDHAAVPNANRSAVATAYRRRCETERDNRSKRTTTISATTAATTSDAVSIWMASIDPPLATENDPLPTPTTSAASKARTAGTNSSDGTHGK